MARAWFTVAIASLASAVTGMVVWGMMKDHDSPVSRGPSVVVTAEKARQAGSGGANETPPSGTVTQGDLRKITAVAAPLPMTKGTEHPATLSMAAQTREPSAARFDPATLTTRDWRALVDSLSSEQDKQLQQAILRKQIIEHRQQSRYQLAADTDLEFLSTRGHPLTEVQEQQVSALKEAIKPQIDAAIGDLWDRREELCRTMDGMYLDRKPSPDELYRDFMPLQNQENRLQVQIREAKAALNSGYMASIRAILTPEQIKVLNDQKAGRS